MNRKNKSEREWLKCMMIVFQVTGGMGLYLWPYKAKVPQDSEKAAKGFSFRYMHLSWNLDTLGPEDDSSLSLYAVQHRIIIFISTQW